MDPGSQCKDFQSTSSGYYITRGDVSWKVSEECLQPQEIFAFIHSLLQNCSFHVSSFGVNGIKRSVVDGLLLCCKTHENMSIFILIQSDNKEYSYLHHVNFYSLHMKCTFNI